MNSDPIRQTLGLDTPPERTRKKRIAWIAAAAVLTVGSGIWYQNTKVTPLEYMTEPVTIKTLTTSVSATGNLEPTNTVEVGIEVSGTIEAVNVDYNDRVKKGEVMARLDTTKLLAQAVGSKASLERFRANIAEAEAAYRNARTELDRVMKMAAATRGNYPSAQEIDDARTAVEKAHAQVAAAKAQAEQARAQLQTDEENIRKATVVSPVEGIVLERKVEPGQTVVASMQTPVLFTMAEDLSVMKAIVSVDEADIGEVKENQKVEFTVDAYPNRIFEGIITQLRLNSQIVNGVVTYDAVVKIDNKKLLLRPGMTVSARIVTGTYPAQLTIPNAALRFTPDSEKGDGVKKAKPLSSGNLRYVWTLRDGNPLKTAVKIIRTDGSSTAVTSTSLKKGDAVIVGTREKH
ncbi:efflux RND transporter periplasmic adaptor subunit [Sulfuricurvum sp. IAE1]|uniref:efflux RND transporter periplasmic adaptor subunit n=1 Tax=Sulfuricurvum sp. IAE1 TaxID=2546102 RepID=UPI001050E104|nr:efflux RND transporter periplasmic adaptor subunit [Sulfuricurvum sp. IAE1]TDA69117.1 efflux RND transporter periplasmic adaptor subunit [Sulfuricurvum sp. IAE1]